LYSAGLFSSRDTPDLGTFYVDHLGFQVRLRTAEGVRGSRIAFLREVRSPEEARSILVEMVEQARSDK